MFVIRGDLESYCGGDYSGGWRDFLGSFRLSGDISDWGGDSLYRYDFLIYGAGESKNRLDIPTLQVGYRITFAGIASWKASARSTRARVS